MTNEEKELLELYLKDSKKKKIILVVLIIIFSIGIIGRGQYYIKNKLNTNNKENEMLVLEYNQNLLNEGSEDSNSVIINENSENISQNTNENDITNNSNENQQRASSIYIKKQEKKSSQQNRILTSNKNESPKISKPPNKDFLFKDGYNMENVSKVAQEYLKSTGYAGECVPLRDDEGVYYGMRVIFY